MREIIVLIPYAFFLYTVTPAQAGCAYLPKNAYRAPATADACDWDCEGGHFRTSPSIALDRTCKKCSNYICQAGQFLTPCQGQTDAFCTNCPIHSNAIYTSNVSCTGMQCAGGYYQTSSQTNNFTCRICDRGYYCISGQRRPCGKAETTYTTGSNQPLYCQPTADSGVNENVLITVYFMVMPAQTSARSDSVQNLLSWVQYGSISKCQVQISKQNSGQLQCVATIGASVSGLYVLWLQSLLNSRAEYIQSLLANALSRQVFLFSIMVTPNTQQDDALNNQTRPSLPRDTPLLQVWSMDWGSNQQEVQLTLFFVTALLSLLFATCTVLFAVAAVQCKLRWHAQRALNEISARNKHILRHI